MHRSKAQRPLPAAPNKPATPADWPPAASPSCACSSNGYDKDGDPCIPVKRTRNEMKIECVTTCVGYGDILAHTLPRNKSLFESILVVTAPEDKQTQKVCDYYRVPYLATDSFGTRWGQFCKGTAINEGLARLKKDAWICHLDSDIVLPPNFREALGHANLATHSLYGVDRVECKSYLDWMRFLDNPEPVVAGNGYFIHTTHSPFQIATRVKMDSKGGYLPIGFFQLWHADSKILKYPEGHSDAGREDSHFATLWPRDKRQLLPEIIVYHLESEAAEMGINWKGRKSKPFTINSAVRDAMEAVRKLSI